MRQLDCRIGTVRILVFHFFLVNQKQNSFYLYLKEKERRREGSRDRYLSLVGLLPKYLQQLGLAGPGWAWLGQRGETPGLCRFPTGEADSQVVELTFAASHGAH